MFEEILKKLEVIPDITKLLSENFLFLFIAEHRSDSS